MLLKSVSWSWSNINNTSCSKLLPIRANLWTTEFTFSWEANTIPSNKIRQKLPMISWISHGISVGRCMARDANSESVKILISNQLRHSLWFSLQSWSMVGSCIPWTTYGKKYPCYYEQHQQCNKRNSWTFVFLNRIWLSSLDWFLDRLVIIYDGQNFWTSACMKGCP